MTVFVGRGMPVGVLESLVGGSHGVDDEVIYLPLLLRLHPVAGIELPIGQGTAGHLGRDLARNVADLEARDPRGAALARENVPPRDFDAAAKRRDHSKTGDDYAPHPS